MDDNDPRKDNKDQTNQEDKEKESQFQINQKDDNSIAQTNEAQKLDSENKERENGQNENSNINQPINEQTKDNDENDTGERLNKASEENQTNEAGRNGNEKENNNNIDQPTEDKEEQKENNATVSENSEDHTVQTYKDNNKSLTQNQSETSNDPQNGYPIKSIEEQEKKQKNFFNTPGQMTNQSIQFFEKILNDINKIRNFTLNCENQEYLKYFSEYITPILKSISELNLNNSSLDYLYISYFFLLNYLKIRSPYLSTDKVSVFELNWIIYSLDINLFFYRNIPGYLNEKIIEDITKEVLYENKGNSGGLIPEDSFISCSYYKITNINLFYKYILEFLLKINFFEAIIPRLIMPICDADSFLYLYYNISKILINYDRELLKLKNYHWPIIKIVMTRFNEIINDPNKELNKLQVDYLFKCNVYSDFSMIDPLYYDGIEKNDDVIQLFQKDLLIAFKMLSSNNLEKRVVGIKNFNELCCFLINIEYNKNSSYESFDQLLNLKRILVIEFLEKVNIFDKIYGENIHEAVIKKSSMILIYLYHNNKINFEQINYLWKLSQEKHQSISESILLVLSDLIPYFSIDLSKHILKIINELNMKEVNDVTVKILESFSNNNNCTNDSPASKDFKEVYLKILMKFSNENSHYNGLTAHIILKSRRVLCEVLLKYNFRHDLYKYVKKCIYGIGCNQILSTHLSILDMLLKNIQWATFDLKPILNVFGNDVLNYNTFVSFLEKKYTLTSTILTSLLDLKKEIIFFSTELIEIQLSNMNSDSMFSTQDIMNDYEMKYDRCLNNIEPLSCLGHNEQQNLNQINTTNISNNSNPQQNPNPKLDITQSTEKSLDDDDENGSVSSISTEISLLEKARSLIIQNFVDVYSKDIKDKKFSLKENYEFIFKKLKLNFVNNNYYSLILSLLSFLKTTIFSTNINLTQNQIQYLFILFVENSVDEEEMNLFFDFFAEVLKSQYLKKENYISEENISYIFFDLLIKLDLISLPFSGYNLFNQIFFLINTAHGNLITNAGRIIDVKKFNQLFGFETLWTFYLETKNQAVSSDSLNLLVNLISTLGKHDDENCKLNFNIIFDKIFQRLYSCTQSLQSNHNDIETEEKTKKLINLLFVINSTKQKIESRSRENLTIIVQNKYYTNDGKSDPIQVSSDFTIKELKASIIDKVISNGNNNFKQSIEETGILIYWKGKLLRDDFLIKDYKIESNSSVMVFKNDPTFAMDDINPQVLANGLIQLKNIFGHLSEELLKCCLKKFYGNVEEAIIYLTDESHVETLTQELLDENSNPFSGEVNQIQSANLELFTEEKINLLIQLLEIGLESVNVYIWKLLSAIKYPNGFIEPITLMKFNEIFNTERKSRLLLFLQLINSLIFGGKFFFQLKQFGERNEWIEQLLIKNNIEIMLKTIAELIGEFSNDKIGNNKSMNRDYIQTIIISLNIMIKWLHYFTFTCSSYLMPNNESLTITQAHILKNRPSSLNIGIQLNFESNTTNKDKNNITPTFNTPQSSLKGNDNNQKGNNHVSSPIGKETSDKFLCNFISFNFHMTILDFIHYISNLNFSQTPCTSQEPEIVLISLLEILIMYNEINEDAFDYTIKYELESSELINLLFTERSKPIRKVVENFFLIISQSKRKILLERIGTKKPANQIVANHIINNYKRIYSTGAYEEFFNLFGHILTHEKEFNCENLEDFNFKDLTEHILTKIHKRSHENEIAETEQEQLTGYVHLLHCLSTNHEEIIIESIEKMTNELDPILLFYNCLFSINSNDLEQINEKISYSNIKFKYSNKNLRQKCYVLLLSLIKLKESFKEELFNKMIYHHKKLVACSNVLPDFDIPFRGKDDAFIGLKNYGATCYLNSLLQQLFMMPSFMKNLYSIQINPKEEKEIHINPIYQLQIAFANLHYTLRKYYPPILFIQSIKEAFGGQTIALGIQQDSDEFFAIITDALEKQAKVYNKENFLEESFKGKISNEIISLEQECPYYNSTDESCIRITLDIKNQRTLEDALDFFIKEEILEGENKYFVEKHNKKLSISKRYLIKHLSNNVIIHLKRFEFDYNRFENSKLNDYISFPHELDFRKWMRSSIIHNNKGDERYKDIILDEEEIRELNDIDSFKYVLTGILIHSGSTLQHGHYYSFIMDQETGKWFRFDDSTVREFNPDNIEQECFGEDRDNINADYQKCQNAYLLFYTKKANIELIKTKSKEGSCFNYNEKIPSEISEMIHKENVDFLKMKTYVDNDYYNFVRDFINYVYLNAKITNNDPNQIINLNESNNPPKNQYTPEMSMTKTQRENEEIFTLVNNIKESSTANINITDSNINEIINKCKCEINSRQSEKIMVNTNAFSSNIFLQKKLLKFGLYYYFEIILNQNDRNKITLFSKFIQDKISDDHFASSWFIKKIEKNPQIFFNNILLDTTQEIRSSIQQLVYSCVIATYKHESQWMSKRFIYIDPNAPNKQKEEYCSCIMRLFNNIILPNFELGRTNWQRHQQFFSLITDCFNYIFEVVKLIPNLPFSLYHNLILFIMNNRGSYKTKYPTMGNSVIEFTSDYALEMLTTLILSSITPGIKYLKVYSKYSKNYIKSKEHGNLDLPNQWDVILQKEVIGDTILKHRSTETEIKLVYHLAYGDENTSKSIINSIMISLRENFKDVYSLYNLINNSRGIFEIDDSLKMRRVQLFFLFDNESDLDLDLSSIFDYLFSFRDDYPFNTFICLRYLGQLIVEYSHIKQNLTMHRERIVWIFYYLKEIEENEIKRSAMQIECSSKNMNFHEIYSINVEVYLNSLGILELMQNEYNEKSKY